MLTLPAALLDALLAHAAAESPRECCGVLGGVNGVVTHALPVENELASPTAFRTAPRAMLAADRALREAGVELLAVYHSNPTSAAVPSVTDRRENPHGEAVLCVIAGTDGVRAWRLHATDATEVPIRVTEPRPIRKVPTPPDTRNPTPG